MFTKEMFESVGLKAELQKRKDWFAANNENDADGRQPETVIGFLSKEVADELIRNPKPGMTMTDCGLTIYSNKEVMFLTDHGTYGYGVLPPNFRAITIGMGNGFPYKVAPRPSLPSGLICCVDDVVKVFYAVTGERLLNSVEELVEYLNR